MLPYPSRHTETWALTVNLSKTKIMVFQKRSICYYHKYKFHLDTVAIEHTKNYTYLGLNISAIGNFHNAVNDLRDKARRAFSAIERNIHFNIPIRIWLKILESVIEPIALYGLGSAHQPRLHKLGQTPNLDSAYRILQKISSVYNVEHQLMHAEQN